MISGHRMWGIVVAAVLAVPVWANDLAPVSPEDVGMSSERLERIGEVVGAHVKSGAVPGAVAMIAREGKVVYTDAWGMADKEEGDAMKPDTIFRIYSMSKPITSVALMMLFEEGKFQLQDPVGKYIPELMEMEVVANEDDRVSQPGLNFPDTDPDSAPGPTPKGTIDTVPARRPMTVQDLLRHTAGFTYGFFGSTPVDKRYIASGILVRDKNIEDTVNKLSKIPLLYQPGEKWHYSVSVDVQGRLIEVLSGMPFDKFLEERIFEPLDMVDTAFYVPEDKMDRFAQMYSPNGKGGLVPSDPNMSRNYVVAPTLFSGGGGLVSTANDYMRFSQMLLNGGELDGNRLISRKTLELMTADHLEGIQDGIGNGYTFGLGFAVAQDLGLIGGLTSPGEFNWGGAAGTKFWVDPEEDLIGVWMIQILPHTGLPFGDEFKNLTYQAIID